jgi:ABC-type uncharacterized transport system permease subunit
MDLAIALAIVTGITEVVKRAGAPTNYVPIVAVIVGLVYSLIFGDFTLNYALDGIILGLTSVGLYRTGQKLVK